MMSVPVSEGASFVTGTPSPLFEDIYRRDHANHLPNYDVASDGRFLMMQEVGGTNGFNLVLHWDEEVKRLVPTE